MALSIRSAADCRYDAVSLGETMVRLSPKGHQRLEFARELEVFVGGGEYNVTYALARLGLRTAWIGGLVDHPLGRLVENHARGGGVDLSHAPKVPYDGIGRRVRMGLNFTEVGTGVRASTTLYDRGHSATAALKPGDVDFAEVFSRQGARWLHSGGIFTCLSPTAAEVAAEALRTAHEAGTVVSYDLNFRSKLWSSEQAIAATRPLLPFIDCLIGNEEDFQKALGYEVEGTDEGLRSLPIQSYQAMVRRVARDYPNLKAIGTTLREVVSGLVNHWSAILYWSETDEFFEGPRFEGLEIEDRVGGGDGFASGLLYGFLHGEEPATCVNLGTAHGALLQSIRGDTSQITAEELWHVVRGGSARIRR